MSAVRTAHRPAAPPMPTTPRRPAPVRLGPALRLPRRRPRRGAVAVGPVAYVLMGGFRSTADINAAPGGLADPWIARQLRRACSVP